MNTIKDNDLEFQICTTQRIQSARDDYRTVLEILGRNIAKKTGNTELERHVQILTRAMIDHSCQNHNLHCNDGNRKNQISCTLFQEPPSHKTHYSSK